MSEPFTELLNVQLSERERAEYALAHAEKQIELEKIEDEKARHAERFNSQIKLLKQEIKDLALKVSTGEELREVQCKLHLCMNIGEAHIYRLDTGEIIRRRPMTPGEYQLPLIKDDAPEIDPAPETDDAPEIDPAPPGNQSGQAVQFIATSNKTQKTRGPIHLRGEKHLTACGLDMRRSKWVGQGSFGKHVLTRPDEVCAECKANDKPAEIADDFTAPRCDECGRLDGRHSEECSHASKLTFADYLRYAQAKGFANPNSQARKMELSRALDDEVRAFFAAEQGTPTDGALFSSAPKEKKPKGKRAKQKPEVAIER